MVLLHSIKVEGSTQAKEPVEDLLRGRPTDRGFAALEAALEAALAAKSILKTSLGRLREEGEGGGRHVTLLSMKRY